MPKSKVKGGGTKKVCLPAAKVKSMSKAQKDKVVRAKESAGKSGKYKVLLLETGLKKKIGLMLKQVNPVVKNNTWQQK